MTVNLSVCRAGAHQHGRSHALEGGAQWGPALARERNTPDMHLFLARSGRCMSTERVEAWAPGGDILLSTSIDAERCVRSFACVWLPCPHMTVLSHTHRRRRSAASRRESSGRSDEVPRTLEAAGQPTGTEITVTAAAGGQPRLYTTHDIRTSCSLMRVGGERPHVRAGGLSRGWWCSRARACPR